MTTPTPPLPEAALPELPVVAQVVDQQPDYPWRTTIRPRGDLSVGQCQALLPQGTLLCNHATATQALRTANERIAELERTGPAMQRGTLGHNGAPWMGTMSDVLDDYREAADVEARLRDEAFDRATAAEARCAALEAALRELVAVKKLKARLISVRSDPYYVTEADRMEAEYARRKPLAWEAARKALAVHQARPSTPGVHRDGEGANQSLRAPMQAAGPDVKDQSLPTDAPHPRKP